jgi:hypothetical protein
MRRASAVACIMWAIAVASGSCTGDDGSTAHDAGLDINYVPYDAGITDPLDANNDTPYYNPDGWVGLQGFDRACDIYVAPSPSAKNFPPPIAWGPCDGRLQSDGGTLSCQQMADNWGSGVAPGHSPVGYVGSAFVDRSTQAVTLPILRGWGTRSLNIVADADGPVRQAIVSLPPNCDLGTFPSLSSTSAIYNIEEVSSDGQLNLVLAGAFGGPIGSPRMLRVYSGSSSLGYVAGANEFAEFGSKGFDTGSWIDGHRIDTLSTTAPGQIEELQFQNDNLFFAVADLTFGRVQMNAPGSGVVDFISFGNDSQSYAADFGTDGNDMVWSEAFGHASDEAPWTTINIVTAPFTTTPSAIVKRRLRSETLAPGDHKFTVGCGYAAHEFTDSVSSGERIVRISDGQSWTLRNAIVPTTRPDGGAAMALLSWNDAVAITCSEIFINFNFGTGFANLARIRLDSLGAGTPPD